MGSAPANGERTNGERARLGRSCWRPANRFGVGLGSLLCELVRAPASRRGRRLAAPGAGAVPAPQVAQAANHC
jgi:hypothetical protein